MSLYVVSLPIGNPDDITLRAIEILKKVDFLICEEFKVARKLLKRLDLQKELYNINEHNEKSDSEEIIQLLLQGQSAALFSDCGTPLFADPGTHLVSSCHHSGIKVVPVPGASSLLSALAMAGVEIKQFYYAGFLPRNSEERRSEMRRFKDSKCPVVIYDTPYRLVPLLEDLHKEVSGSRNISLMISLTQPDERIIKGSLASVLKQVKAQPFKKEYVLVLEPPLLTFHKKSKSPVKTRKRR